MKRGAKGVWNDGDGASEGEGQMYWFGSACGVNGDSYTPLLETAETQRGFYQEGYE